jgi:hypothetical protein
VQQLQLLTKPSSRVLNCPNKPRDCFAAVCSEGHWFWIDNRDPSSKRTVGDILFLLALADTGAKENLPVATIPAG